MLETIHNVEEILPTISRLKQQANNQCMHSYEKELSFEECKQRGIPHFGNCYHVYECPKCNKTFTVDSSD